jgi:hypothetical protein
VTFNSSSRNKQDRRDGSCHKRDPRRSRSTAAGTAAVPMLKGAESLGAVTGSCCGTRLGAVGSSIGSTVKDPLEDSNGIEQMDPTNRSEVSL